jgi:hypothetical protein
MMPLRLPRSSTVALSPVTVSTACWREINGSSTLS